MCVGVMTVGVMSVEEITVGVMTVGVMRRPPENTVIPKTPSHRVIDYYIYFIDENKRYSRKFRGTTQQNTSKLGTFVNFMCVYKCSVRSQ
jgi:hypothetical protein